MKIESLENKSIAILGFGVTGSEVYQSLKADYQITVINDTPVNGIESFTKEKVKDRDFDVIIKSPGVPYSNPILQNGKRITNDIELCYEYINDNNLKTKIVAVTGTNGKTTSTYFINTVLENAGYRSIACGNIGQSPLLVVSENNNLDYIVIELSSYQLKQIKDFTPDYALFLNITPDHIDYHGGFDDYLASKCNIFKNMTTEPLVIGEDVETGCKLPENTTFGVTESVFKDFQTMAIPHQNLKLILDILFKMNIDESIIKSSIKEFKGLEHRIEIVETDGEYTAINDSKATNVVATNVAISNTNGPTHLIVGGSVKLEDYTLLDCDNSNLVSITSYGDAREKFDFIDGIESYQEFEKSVLAVKAKVKPGETILLSPACASYDQHKNYIERGREFKRLMKGNYE